MSQTRYRNYVFTHNNYPDTHLQDNLVCRYIIYGKEVGESGTPHLQGFVTFENGISHRSAINKLPGCHVEVAHSPQAAIEYCKKEGDFTERGIPPMENKRKGETQKICWEEVLDAAKERRFLEIPPAIRFRYHHIIKEIAQDHVVKKPVEAHPLHPWQEDLNQLLNREPNNRTIHFVVDPIGNKGKTWFARYYCQLHDNAQYLESAKKTDLAYAVRDDIRVLFINCARTKTEYLDYSFLEGVKDQMVFCAKYNSHMKHLEKCHLVVMTNEMPNMLAMSADRYNIIEI